MAYKQTTYFFFLYNLNIFYFFLWYNSPSGSWSDHDQQHIFLSFSDVKKHLFIPEQALLTKTKEAIFPKSSLVTSEFIALTCRSLHEMLLTENWVILRQRHHWKAQSQCMETASLGLLAQLPGILTCWRVQYYVKWKWWV